MSGIDPFSALRQPSEILADAQPALYPVITGLYFLLMKSQIVYVGQSMNCHKRIHAHMASEKEFDSYTILPMDAELDLNSIEALYILKFQPRYNMNLPACSHLITPVWFRTNRVRRAPLRRLVAEGKLEALQFRELTFYWRHEIESYLNGGLL